MKKYLGLIYISYGVLILYTLITNTLKNYLSPQLQIYIKIALIPLLIVGIALCVLKKVNYKFKISDSILLIPLIMIFISGDGLLSLGLAENRSSNLMNRDQTNITQTTNQEIKKEELPANTTYDFTKPDFEVIDANYEGLANYLTFSEKAKEYVGKTIKLRGFTVKYASYLPDGMFAIGKYIITCCVADASFGGFYVKYDLDKISHNKWYEIEGVLEQGIDKDGYSILYINLININEIDSSNEEQYIYPCYVYDDGLCKEVLKYNIEY